MPFIAVGRGVNWMTHFCLGIQSCSFSLPGKWRLWQLVNLSFFIVEWEVRMQSPDSVNTRGSTCPHWGWPGRPKCSWRRSSSTLASLRVNCLSQMPYGSWAKVVHFIGYRVLCEQHNLCSCIGIIYNHIWNSLLFFCLFIRVLDDTDVQQRWTWQPPWRGHLSPDIRLLSQRVLPQGEEEDSHHWGAQCPHPQMLRQLPLQQPGHDLPITVLRL